MMKRHAIMATILSVSLLLADCPVAFGATEAEGTTGVTSSAIMSSPTTNAAIDIPRVSPVSDGGHTAADAADSSIAVTPVVTRLSLAEAIRIMQTTGTSAETAQLHKKSDEALVRGYKETVDSIRDALNSLDDLQEMIKYLGSGVVEHDLNSKGTSIMGTYASVEAAGATVTNRKIMQLRRDFASDHIETNYQAELNGIEYTTVQLYYGVLLATDNLKITRDNLNAQKEILRMTEVQLKVGMVAKKDVLAAQSAVESAKSDVQAAETKLKNAKMSFNFLLGYPVMQPVTFTDQLTPVTGLSQGVDSYVQKALHDRMEIAGADYAKQVHTMLLESLKYRYPTNSSTYLTQQVAYMDAAKVAKDARSKIEMDVRMQYAGISDAKAAMESAKVTRTYAEEGYRLLNLSYQAGMCTLAEVQAAQVMSYKANLGVAAATSQYDLAMYQFKYATAAGTTRLPF